MSVGVGTVAFSGSREVPEGGLGIQRAAVRAVAARTYVTGACCGVDQTVAALVAQHWPNRVQRIVVPRNRALVDEVWLAGFAETHRNMARVDWMPRGTTYRDRNLALLGEPFVGVPALRPNLLIAFPLYPERHPASRRSGTWMTVRMALSMGIQVQVHLLLPDLSGVERVEVA